MVKEYQSISNELTMGPNFKLEIKSINYNCKNFLIFASSHILTWIISVLNVSITAKYPMKSVTIYPDISHYLVIYITWINSYGICYIIELYLLLG